MATQLEKFILGTVPLTNFTVNGAIGLATTTVDIASSFSINQTTVGITLTIPNPTTPMVGQVLTIINVGTVAVTVGGLTIPASQTGVFNFSGTVWTQSASSGVSTNIPNSPNSTLAPLTVTNKATGGVLGTALTTTDVNSSFNLNQTTTGQTITLANPTVVAGSRVVTITNVGTATFGFYGQNIGSGQAGIAQWNGTVWSSVGTGTNVVAGYAYVRSSGSQISTNLASTDHVQFTVAMNVVGGDITSDTTTAYTNANGVNSLGRFLLKANRTYELEGSIGDATFSGSANSWVSYSWFNADTGVAINLASQCFVYNTGASGAFSFPSNTSASTIAQSIFSPTVDTRVELRITNSSGFTGYGGGLNSIASYAKIKVISGNSPVTGQSVDYVRLSKTSTQSISSANTPITFNSVIGNITANTGTGAITLTAGKTYELMAGVNSVTAPAVPRPVFTWFNQTTGLAIGDQFGFYSPADTAGNGGGGGISHMILTPSVTTIIELRSLIAIIGGLIASGDFAGGAGESAWATVKQLGSTATVGGNQVPITLTTTGSGISTFNQTTGALNIPFVTPVNLARVRANTATATFSASPGTTITWSNEEYDTTNSFTPATGIFVAPRTAYYVINFQLIASATGTAGARYGYIMAKNNAAFGAGNPIISQFISVINPSNLPTAGGATIFMNAGDDFRLRGFLDTSTAGSLSANANFDFLTISELPSTI